jgi:hypothetical protein
MLRTLRNGLLCISLASLFSGCAHSSHVLIGTARPAISPDQVKVYLHPPARYEEVAIIDASSQGSMAFTDQQKMNRVIDRMKAQAAELGANGILLESAGDQYAGSVETGFGSATGYGNTATATGLGVSAGVFMKSGKGLAIYVPTT